MLLYVIYKVVLVKYTIFWFKNVGKGHLIVGSISMYKRLRTITVLNQYLKSGVKIVFFVEIEAEDI